MVHQTFGGELTRFLVRCRVPCLIHTLRYSRAINPEPVASRRRRFAEGESACGLAAPAQVLGGPVAELAPLWVVLRPL